MPPIESVAMPEAITRMFSILATDAPPIEFWYVELGSLYWNFVSGVMPVANSRSESPVTPRKTDGVPLTVEGGGSGESPC